MRLFPSVWLSHETSDVALETTPSIQDMLESEINRMINIPFREKVQSDILRNEIKELLLTGEKPKGKEIGTLVIVDIVGSTSISNESGNEK